MAESTPNGVSERRVAERTERLLAAVRAVTLEEFRAEDAHFERHSRLGRELLYLVANNSWCRRTTEIVDVSQAQAVDTDVVVDVDLAYTDHEAFQSDAGLIWVPLLALPQMRPAEPRDLGRPERKQFGRRAARARPDELDPIASLEVSDAAGARVPKLPQHDVHQRLAAALAEILLNVMAARAQSNEADDPGAPRLEREHKLLLSAAIRRLLPGDDEPPAARGGTVPAGLRQARVWLEHVLDRDLELAQAALAAAVAAPPRRVTATSSDDGDLYEDLDGAGGRLRPVLGAHVGEILDALVGTTLVVAAVEDPGHPISYTVHVPSRRLTIIGRSRAWIQPRALLSIDLLAPTAHADRQIRLVLPDGVICHDGSAGVTGRIDVVLPAPFERLETLMRRLFPASLPSDRPASWVDARIAEMALHKVDAALDSLRHYRVTRTRGTAAAAKEPDPDQLTATVDQQLRRLREELATVRRAGAGPVRTAALRNCWEGGAWFPVRMRRRIGVNTASSNLVMMRATAIEDVGLRARPTTARIDADVSVFESPVFNVARYAGWMNVLVLATLMAVLHWGPLVTDEKLQLIATVLTLFSAVQAGRVEHPDASTLRGLLSRASYWVMTASVLPTVLLALSLAALPPTHSEEATGIALAFQVLLFFRLRRGPLSRWRRNSPPHIILATGFVPDHARVDVLRGNRSRALLTEALTLGREAYAYVVVRPAGRDQFTGLLERSQGGGVVTRVEDRLTRVAGRAARLLAARGLELPGGGQVPARPAGTLTAADPTRTANAANLLGVVQSATAGRAMTYLVFRERPAGQWPPPDHDADAEGDVEAIPLDPDRLAPMERPEWVLEILVGIPETVTAIELGRHPLMDVVTDTQRYNFRVMTVQLPAPPPPGGTGRRWMRLQVGVTYRRGDSLRGLGGFLYRLHRMDGVPFGGGTLAVRVRVNAERSMPPADGASRPLSDRDFDVVPDDEAAQDPTRSWRTLALTAHTRVGLLHDVLAGLAEELPSFELAGLTAAAVYGQTVFFLVGRERIDAGRPGSGTTLRRSLPNRVRRSDRLVVAVDQRLTARALDGAAGVGDQLLLQVGIRTPDRPGVLRDTLRDLRQALTEHGPPDVPVPGLDVWFVLLEVVNGRTTRGRLTVRLPGKPGQWADWQRVDWGAVERSMTRAWSSSDLDDTVITAQLLRTVVPRPLVPPVLDVTDVSDVSVTTDATDPLVSVATAPRPAT